MGDAKFDRSGSAWISRSFATLVAGTAADPQNFDVLIVGSGYGGAIAADTLTRCVKGNGQPIDIGVLERGEEYLPGSFPANSTELAGHVRFGRNKTGLFDFRAGPDVSALVANGLGGGSLINAGVMKRPLDDVFDHRWPAELSTASSMEKFYERIELLLGARIHGAGASVPNKIDKSLNGDELKKITALRDLGAAADFAFAPVTVANSDKANAAYVQLSQCIRCGDCATGCNHNAKDSLDVNLLVNAHRRGARIYSGATVLRVERNPADDGWLVYAIYTDTKLRKQQPGPIVLAATNVILAAGTFGSTEILKRSAAGGLHVSRMLGQKCSTNGDTMITHYDTGNEVNAVGKEDVAPEKREIGPTIAGILDLREHPDPDLNGLLIEEMASPASMRRIFGEIYATANALHRLGDCDRTAHETGYPADDIYELKEARIDNSALYAVMGDDGAHGEIEVPGPIDASDSDGTARMRWPDVAHHPLFDKQVRALRKLAEGKPGAIIENPLWQLLPEKVALLTKVERGPVVTVHPLGGCSMADTSSDGVVNRMGAVFDQDDSATTHAGLAVLDGSIIPVALGINPALTIAAVSLQAAVSLVVEWGYQHGPNSWTPAAPDNISPEQEIKKELFGNAPPPPPLVRPRFRKDEIEQAFDPEETMVRLTERMSGGVTLFGGSGMLCQKWLVELTLRFHDKSLVSLTRPSANDATLHVLDGGGDPVVRSRLRIFKAGVYDEINHATTARELEEQLEEGAEFSTPVSAGTLRIFERQKSWFVWRILRGSFAWKLNHGLRDIWQAVFSAGAGFSDTSILDWFKSLIALCTRAGEVRKFRYELTLRDPVPEHICGTRDDARRVAGEKRFTYALHSNPWNQLMQMRLTRFPGMVPWWRSRLDLDLPFLARIRIPLLEIVKQNDGVTALAELGSFLAYFARMLVGIHGFSFRAPDEPVQVRQPQRLPGKVDGIAQHPEIHTLYLGEERPHGSELDAADPASAVPVYVRLARYTRTGSGKPPLIMMHGYSASGTTFAHDAVKNNFVEHFHANGRDVWVADFRTSCGMPTAREPWSFEQVAYRDVPEVVKYVCERTDYVDPVSNAAKADVIAHCMGAAMFSMGLLHSDQIPEADFANKDAREALPQCLRRVVFTQVGPVLVMAPMNIFRGYVTQFFREMLPDRYEFDPGPNPGVDDRLLDRLLATVPYSKKEFRVENPILPWKRTPWTRTRHRMDILYGRVFNSENMDKKVLGHIDDFFGPLSIDTVTQTINFARYNVITNVDGRNTFVARKALDEKWNVPLLFVNADANGLVDRRSAHRMKRVFGDAGCSLETKTISNAGHQDCLIGKRPRKQALDEIADFLDRADTAIAPGTSPSETMVAYTPWIGPLRTTEPGNPAIRTFRVGSHPTHRYTEGVLLFRVQQDGATVTRPDGEVFGTTQADLDYLQDHAFFLTSDDLRYDYWGKFELPPDQDGNAWLALLLYADSEALNQTTSGYYRHGMVPLPDGTMVGYLGRIDNRTTDWSFPDLSLYTARYSVKAPRGVDFDALVRDGVLVEQEDFDRMKAAALKALGNRAAPIEGANLYSDAPGPGSARELDLTVPLPPELGDGGSSEDNGTGIVVALAGHEAALDRLTDETFDLSNGVMPDVDNAPADECEFLLSSCQYPAGFLDGALAYQSYRETIQRLQQEAGQGDPVPIKPRFGLFVGDQIYADASAGLFDPSVRRGRFELPYQMWLRFPYVRSVLRRIPTYMLPDDHEVTDNWEPLPNDAKNTALKEAGIEGYEKYQRGIAVAPHFHFEKDGCEFWMLNTRSQREQRAAVNAAAAKIIDEPALAELATRLGSRGPDAPPLFVVTPSMLLPRHRRAAQWDAVESCLHSDGWDGYPSSLFRMLKHAVDTEVRNVVFLSGDEHLPCYARIAVTDTVNNRASVLYSIHTAAAYAPFPFANGFKAQQLDHETLFFNFGANSVEYQSDKVAAEPITANYQYRCMIETTYPPPGDAMTKIRVRKSNAHWSLRAEFGAHAAIIDNLSA